MTGNRKKDMGTSNILFWYKEHPLHHQVRQAHHVHIVLLLSCCLKIVCFHCHFAFVACLKYEQPSAQLSHVSEVDNL